MPDGVLVFDMDGVLVDVTESYRETIRQTVRYFTGQEIGNERIQDLKNAGGWTNDWARRAQDHPRIWVSTSTMDAVVAQFQSIFLGDGRRRADAAREVGGAAGAAGTSEPPLPAGGLHGAAAARRPA